MNVHQPDPTPLVDSAKDSAPPTSAATERVSFGFILIYSLAMLGFWMAINLPGNVTLALRIAEIDPETRTQSYSFISGVGVLAGIIAGPIFGQLSDRTRSRFGKRRPWIVFGVAGIIVASALLGLTDSFAVAVVGWVLMQLSAYAAIAVMFAIVADRVPQSQQGLIGALAASASALSVVLGIPLIQIFPTSVLAQFGLPALVAVLFGVAMLILLKDDAPYLGGKRYRFRDLLGSFAFNPRRTPDFALLIGAMFLLFIGEAVIGTYAVYFLQDRLQIPFDEVSSVLFIAYIFPGLLTIIVAPLTGWVTDKMGRRKPALLVAAPVIVLSLILLGTATNVPQFVIGMTLAGGVGGAMVAGSFVPFVISTIEDQTTIARNLGFANIALSLPYSVVPFVAPLVLGSTDAPNYGLLYVLAGAAVLASIPLVLRIRIVR